MRTIFRVVIMSAGLGSLLPCLAAEEGAGDRWAKAFPGAGEEPLLVYPGIISTGDDESHPTLSPDGRTLYYLKNTPMFDFYTIIATEWRDGRWTRPRTVPFSGQHADGDLVFAPGGRHAFFVSYRPVDGVPRKDSEIWRLERTPAGWGEPEHVAELSSPGDEFFPTLTAEGTMYFGSSREGGLGGHDIWRSRLVGGVYQKPENLGAPVNSAGEEIEAFVNPEEDLLVIAAKNRGDEIGSYDLYVSTRGPDGWAVPSHPGAPINSAGWDFSPRMSPDGGLFFFTSSRGFASMSLNKRLTFEELERKIRTPGNGLRDIYVLDADVIRSWAEAGPADPETSS